MLADYATEVIVNLQTPVAAHIYDRCRRTRGRHRSRIDSSERVLMSHLDRYHGVQPGDLQLQVDTPPVMPLGYPHRFTLLAI